MVLEEFLDAWSFGLGTPRVNGVDCFSVLRVEFFETRFEMVEGNGVPITHQFGVDKFLDNVAQETGHMLSFSLDRLFPCPRPFLQLRHDIRRHLLGFRV